MSCFGFVFSFLRRSETVDGQRYQILKAIGEGGKWVYLVNELGLYKDINDMYICVYTVGFSYVYLVTKEGRQYAMVSL